MRPGSTQSTPTANPEVILTVGTDVYASVTISGVTPRLVSAYMDEQETGGNYIFKIDNDDGTLTEKDYRGSRVYVYIGFVDEPTNGSVLSKLRVIEQEFISEEGKLLLVLYCTDWIGMLAYYTGVRTIWNYPEQSPAFLAAATLPVQGGLLPAWLQTAITAYYDKTAWEIVDNIITNTIGNLGVTITDIDNDPTLDSSKPLVAAPDARTAIFQALRETKSRIRQSALELKLIQPDLYPIVYTFDVANTFFSNVVRQGVVIPNTIVYHGITAGAGGTEIYTASPYGEDEDSIARLGNIYEHNNFEYKEREALQTQAAVDDAADDRLDNLRISLVSGLLITPMHCSLELWDKVEVVDERYP